MVHRKHEQQRSNTYSLAFLILLVLRAAVMQYCCSAHEQARSYSQVFFVPINGMALLHYIPATGTFV